MKSTDLRIPGLKLLEPAVHRDERGAFFEAWNRARYAAIGIDVEMVQSNVSVSQYGVLRGLHHQWPRPQGKLVWVQSGEVWDVAVDIRRGSPSFGRSEAVTLSAENGRQLWLPPGFAHGFVVLSEQATFCYLCTEVYDREGDASIRWDDPDLAIDWPIARPSLSPKDASAPLLASIDPSRLPDLSA